jgi:hypothetical protein
MGNINPFDAALEQWATHLKTVVAQATGANVTALRKGDSVARKRALIVLHLYAFPHFGRCSFGVGGHPSERWNALREDASLVQ